MAVSGQKNVGFHSIYQKWRSAVSGQRAERKTIMAVGYQWSAVRKKNYNGCRLSAVSGQKNVGFHSIYL